jgi:AhpD family alkylhydroperoxidase
VPRRKLLLLSIAVPTLATGAWAVVAPSSWHQSFPGLGRHWLPPFGAYNEHLARDFGGALLALGVLLMWTALSPGSPLRRVVPGAFLAFALPHFVFHLAHLGELPAADDAVNLVLLGLSVAVPLALLVMPDEPPLSMRAAPWPLTGRMAPAPERGLLVRLAYRLSRRRFGHVLGPLGLTAHNPTLLAAYSTFELALERAGRVDRRLEELGATGAATMTGCPFCLDYAFGMLSKLGFSPAQVADIPVWRSSGRFSADERLVLEYAESMSATPVHVSDQLFERLRARFDEPALVELTAAIAFENYRGRFNHALGLGPEGFCPVPPTNGRALIEAAA